ncbi:Astacin-like metalloendopeptidase [Strongyloides ratti]|uniref:Metalloendopeptidase n=1 Tax=Strongyloides ratti TaxID=34506 RepID=A0A090LRW1_STRRB|nr:Astacin-like metalloendopeptidase [Strongyloides ratti]CEF70321.1 Astacin-like metalloendopeptidase [Strongyloides ratti]
MIVCTLLIIIFQFLNAIFLNNDIFDNYNKNQKFKRETSTYTSNIWPEKEIPYFVHPYLSYNLIRVALLRISKETCLRFEPKLHINESLFIYLPGKYYETNLGRGREIPHRIFVPQYLQDIGKVIRETMRALGIEYEHNRQDRNNFIKVYTYNIKNEYLKYFKIEHKNINITYNTDYDFRSIMHFSSHEYAKTWLLNVIYPKFNFMLSSLGVSKHLTFNDGRKLNDKYCKYKHIPYPNCLNYGYQHPTTPIRCKCLSFLTGERCENFLPNPTSCTQNFMYQAINAPRKTILRVGGKCFFILKANEGKVIRLRLNFYKNLRTPKICTEENSVEIIDLKYKSSGGFLYCPRPSRLFFTSSSNIIILLTSFREPDIKIKIEYFEFHK